MHNPDQNPTSHLGTTRSASRRDHLLQTPDTFVRIVLPGMQRAAAIVHIGPAAGASFTQYTAELEPTGLLGKTSWQRFVYVLEGELLLTAQYGNTTLRRGSFAYIPTATPHALTAQTKSRVAIIEKPYEPLEGTEAPKLLTGQESDITSTALMGDEDLQVRALLPEHSAFDFAVNTMTYQPGTALAMVEIHVMEHGLLMLEGGGIYRLGEHWYPVTAGDFIWMGPFCPQWFGALGKQPAKYLIYKDFNR